MKIEIKNLKIAEFASEETLCYQATIYVDGQRAILGRNDGHGGPDFYEPCTRTPKAVEAYNNALEAIQAHLKTLPEIECEFGNYRPDMETLINRAITQAQTLKDVKRALGKGICFKKPEHESGQYSYFKCTKVQRDHYRALVAKKHADAIILNDLAGDALLNAMGLLEEA